MQTSCERQIEKWLNLNVSMVLSWQLHVVDLDVTLDIEQYKGAKRVQKK